MLLATLTVAVEAAPKKEQFLLVLVVLCTPYVGNEELRRPEPPHCAVNKKDATDSLRERCRPSTKAPKPLMLRGHGLARQLLHCFLRPAGIARISIHYAHPNFESHRLKGINTHMSPNATIHIVCQTPSPILGVTPRYSPFSPLLP